MVDESRKEAKTDDDTPILAMSKIKVAPIHDHVVPEDDGNKKTSDEEESIDEETEKDDLEAEEIDPIKLADQDDKPKDAKQEPKTIEDVVIAKDDAEAKPEPTPVAEPTDQTSKGAQEKIDEIANRKAAERAAEIQKLAESHKYFLPINQVEKRRNKRAAWAGVVLVLLLAIVWADVALDAGLVTVPGITAPTHFFK